jgi:hypothetical protein
MIGQEVVMRVLVPAVAVFASSLAALAAAQTPETARPPAAQTAVDATDPDPDSADLSITATVHYESLKFEVAGTPKVEFTGGLAAAEPGRDAPLRTVWHADRGSLPRPVQPGVVYGPNTIKLTITSRFEDLARLFAEDAAPAPAPSPQP